MSGDLSVAFDICADVKASGGRALIVGGAVRDRLRNGGGFLAAGVKDYDIEVFGLSGEQLKDVLRKHGHIDIVGEAFGVIKMLGKNIDVSLPRIDSKRGMGHRGFEVAVDPHMTLEKAARRRDFTINAISHDPITSTFIDPCGGEADLKAGVLRMVDRATFGDDPLRVLRGMQFCARFDLVPSGSTVHECKRLLNEAGTLAVERVWEEWRKFILAPHPSRGLEFLRMTSWLDLYPELGALIGCEQDPEWHPEGDVWVHTMHCMDALAAYPQPDVEQDKMIAAFAVLCHDLGKPPTTEFINGRWRAHGHEGAGAAPARAFMSRIGVPKAIRSAVIPLIENHLAPVVFFKDQVSNRAMLRLANRVGRLDLLGAVCYADQAGRPPAPVNFEALDWFANRASLLNVVSSKPEPIVKGRHLIEHLGMAPSNLFGPLLAACMEAQLDGQICTLDQGLSFAQTWEA